MNLSLAEFKRALSRKRSQPETGQRREKAAVKKRPRAILTIRSPRRGAEDEEGALPEIPIAVPNPTPLPVVIPSDEGAAEEAGRRNKGKAPMVSSAPEEEEEMIHISMSVPASSTAIGSKALAQELFRTIVLPKDREARKNRSLEENIKSFYSGMAKFVTDISIIQDGMAEYGIYVRELTDQMESAKADAEVADELRKAGEIREGQLREELRIIRARCQQKEDRIKELEEQSVADNERNKALQGELTEEKVKRRKAEEHAEAAKKNCKAAAEEAVSHFRNSSEYRDDIIENCLEAFQTGFKECKQKVAAAFPELDLSSIVELDEEGTGEVEAATEEGDESGLAAEVREPSNPPAVNLQVGSVTGADLEVAPLAVLGVAPLADQDV